VEDQTILIVDDDKVLRKMMSKILATIGSIVIAENGEEALEKAKSIQPDLIVMDIMMPGMDGYEVCKILKENDATATIPVIFLTAKDTTEAEEKGLKIGATDYIRKPISPHILLTRSANILKFQSAIKSLKLQALTDPLTGAYNRRHLFNAGENEFLRSKRYGHALCVLMLDIDHFKAVNDDYGHGTGDEALKETVRAIEKTLRSEDTLGRIGGEEFAVVLPETDLKNATILAERLRAAIGNIAIQTRKTILRLTVSIGVYQAKVKEDDIQSALKQADELLYEAKETGRNRVISG
jgi:diguanylate cyclase (GGDEF)-like protein